MTKELNNNCFMDLLRLTSAIKHAAKALADNPNPTAADISHKTRCIIQDANMIIRTLEATDQALTAFTNGVTIPMK